MNVTQIDQFINALDQLPEGEHLRYSQGEFSSTTSSYKVLEKVDITMMAADCLKGIKSLDNLTERAGLLDELRDAVKHYSKVSNEEFPSLLGEISEIQENVMTELKQKAAGEIAFPHGPKLRTKLPKDDIPETTNPTGFIPHAEHEKRQAKRVHMDPLARFQAPPGAKKTPEDEKKLQKDVKKEPQKLPAVFRSQAEYEQWVQSDEARRMEDEIAKDVQKQEKELQKLADLEREKKLERAVQKESQKLPTEPPPPPVKIKSELEQELAKGVLEGTKASETQLIPQMIGIISEYAGAPDSLTPHALKEIVGLLTLSRTKEERQKTLLALAKSCGYSSGEKEPESASSTELTQWLLKKIATPLLAVCYNLSPPKGAHFLTSLPDSTDFEKATRIEEWIRSDLNIKEIRILQLNPSHLKLPPSVVDELRSLHILFLDNKIHIENASTLTLQGVEALEGSLRKSCRNEKEEHLIWAALAEAIDIDPQGLDTHELIQQIKEVIAKPTQEVEIDEGAWEVEENDDADFT